MSLRPYQQEAVDAVRAWCKSTTSPCVVEAPTGAGKSHIIAAIADWLHTASKGKMVLCLAPSAELVTQNRQKFIDRTGRQAGLMSASAGKVSMAHPVIFGSPLTVVNRIDKLAGLVCAVVIDEAHGVTPTIMRIVEGLREKNPLMRVVGLTATPYRLGDGYIYREDETGMAYGDDMALDPYFARRVYQIPAWHLIEQGYLTRPVIGQHTVESYDTTGLTINRMGNFDAATVDRAFVGHGRKTAEIVADVVARSKGRVGVMFFGSTITHCHEIMASLPPGISAMITSETPKKERAEILEDFKSQWIKYLVNVSVLTTGFDAPHVDVIALLRATESVALMQQMIGRGLRINEDKTDCLVLDYAGNIERHCPHGDLFDPDIKADNPTGGCAQIEARCPDCSTVNLFTALPDINKWDENGYALDLSGKRIGTEYGPQPAHYGRRCGGWIQVSGVPELLQCSYRWTSKECPECKEPNDIAARRCIACKAEMVNPNEKLRIEFTKMKQDPFSKQCEEVIDWKVASFTSKKGNPCKVVEFQTAYRKVDVYFTDQSGFDFVQKAFDMFEKGTKGWTKPPRTITYRKSKKTGYFKILAVNKEPDEIPAVD